MKKKKLKSLKLSIRKNLLIWLNMLKKTLKLHKRSNRKQDLGKKKNLISSLKKKTRDTLTGKD